MKFVKTEKLKKNSEGSGGYTKTFGTIERTDSGRYSDLMWCAGDS